MTPFEYISQEKFQSFKPGFDRINALLDALGHPERNMRFIHVAGTNGKGSVSACISSILTHAGFCTGLYTSPYVTRWNERVQVCGEYISDDDFATAVDTLRPIVEAMDDAPSQFELETALAFWYFSRRKCDFAVVEVGMGGAWDATNVIPSPEVAVLCAIALDHTAILGKTISEIATVKSGIIKPGCDVVSYANEPDAEAVFEKVCNDLGCRLTRPDYSLLHIQQTGLDGITFDYGEYGSLFLPLAGTYQPMNAALALAAVDALRNRGFSISDEAILSGLHNVRWPGRFELLSRSPVFILDGSHNPQGMEATVKSIKVHFPDEKIWFLLGVMADKDVSGIARLLGPIAAGFAAVEPPNPRAMKPNALSKLLHDETGVTSEAFDTIEAGAAWVLNQAGEHGVCAAIGSLYFSGQVRTAVNKLTASN